MPPRPDWVPMRWPDGPFWSSPASLEILRGTPFNCLALPWSAGSARDFASLLEAGRRAGLSFVGWLDAAAGNGQALAAAKSAGLDAVASRSPSNAAGFAWIPVAGRAKLPWDSAAPLLAATEGVWPSVKASAHGDDSAEAGPTGLPWIDTNGWYIRLASALAPEKTLWMAIEPPKQTAVLGPSSYLRAIADSEVYGARWLLMLDGHLAAGMASGDAQPLAAWKSIARTAAFFGKHRDWRAYRAAATLGVLSDFRGDNEFLSGETLNLLSRRQLGFVILEKSRALAASFAGLKAILYADPEPPAPGLVAKLQAFARAGGLVISRASSRIAGDGAPAGPEHLRFDVRAFGRGRVAVAREDFSDPFVLAADTHILLSRRNDLYRVWNSPAAGTYYTAAADGRKALLQIVNYAGTPTDHLAVRFERRYRRARLWTFAADEPEPLDVVAAGGSTECRLPAISVYAAVELEA